MSSTASKTASNSSRSLLHGYQERSIDFIKSTPSCALWAEMGLGKTISVLTALSDMFDTFEIGRVLIIAPLRVAKHTWPTEIEAWDHVSHLSYSVLCGTRQQRLNALERDTNIHIINRDNVVWLVGHYGKKWPYDTVVIDESSSFKSSRAKRFKALKKTLPKIERVVELTGTPASNGLLDLWSQTFLIDAGERLGRTFTGFRNAYFESDYMGYNYTPRHDSAEKIYDKLQDVCLTLSAEDYLEMPDRIDNIIRLQMPRNSRAQYRYLEREFLLELEQDTVVVANAAVLTNKLLQFSNGALYTDEEGSYEQVHDAKLDALDEIVQEAAGQPVLVAYNFKSDLARIQARFSQAEILGNSSDTIDRWNAGEIQMLCAHPASAGHGLNLQHGGNILVWFGLNWSLELYQQFNARLHRQGQTKPVFVHHLAVTDSVDMTVLEALQSKHSTQKALLDALKRDIESRSL